MSGRIRTIKPEILDDEKTGHMPSDDWRLFVSLWLLADDHGNLRCDPDQIHAAVFWGVQPRAHTRELLASLREGGLITFYTARGQRYASISNWKKHQRIDRPSAPRVPGPQHSDSSDESGGDIEGSRVPIEGSRVPIEGSRKNSRGSPISDQGSPIRDQEDSRGTRESTTTADEEVTCPADLCLPAETVMNLCMATGSENWQVDEAVKQCRTKWVVRGDRKRLDEWLRYLRGAATQICQNSEERAKLKRHGEWRPPPVTPEQNAARIASEERQRQRQREENDRYIAEHGIVVPKTPEELTTRMVALMRDKL